MFLRPFFLWRRLASVAIFFFCSTCFVDEASKFFLGCTRLSQLFVHPLLLREYAEMARMVQDENSTQ